MTVRGLEIVTLVALTLVVLTTAARIEILNTRAGYYLPRQDGGTDGKWRESAAVSEELWRGMLGPKTLDDAPVARPLTPGEQEQMHRDIAHNRANANLRSVVRSWGLLQYPLILITFGLSLRVLHGGTRGRVALAAASILICAVAGWLAWYRAYFPSLGW